MAEIMLLVVFTLLLVAGALLQKSNARIKQLEEDRPSLAEVEELKQLRQELGNTRKSLPESWRELVRIKKELAQLGRGTADGHSVLKVVSAAEGARKTLESLGYDLTSVTQIPDLLLTNMPRADRATG